MSEQEVGQVLLQDIQNNLALFQLLFVIAVGAFSIWCIGIAMRASALLTQTRVLFQEASVVDAQQSELSGFNNHGMTSLNMRSDKPRRRAATMMGQKSRKTAGKNKPSIFR